VADRSAGGQARLAAPRRGFFESLRIYCERHAQTFVSSLGRLSRQPLATFMTVAVIAIALALPASLDLFARNARAATGEWHQALDISVFFKRDVRLAKAEQLAENLRARPGVADVRFVPADTALREFREFSGFGPALDALTENPLPHSLVVRPSPQSAAPADIANLQRYLQNWPEVELVQIDREWVTRFHSMLDVLRRVVTLAGALLAVGVLVIVGNTIRLDIENRRTEIEVTKLVGGSDAFVRRPFLYTGVWYGVAGGLLAWGLVSAGVYLLSAPVNRLAGLYGSTFTLQGLGWPAIGVLVGGGAALGWFGSWISSARHLRAIEPRA
jgi:cell division transport system permease protein